MRIRFLIFFSGLLWLPFVPAKGQILDDAPTMVLIQEGIDHVYNYEFGEVERIVPIVRQKYPGHPVTYFMRAFQLYWQYLPVQDNKVKVKEYLQNLNQCLAAVEKHYGKNSEDPETEALELTDRNPEYLFIAGTYNYYVEAYPEDHAIVRPLMIFF